MTRGNSPLRYLVALALVVAIALVSSAPPARPARADTPAVVTVNDDEASSDFPNGLSFKLNVDGERPITGIELLYQAADLATLNLSVPNFTPGTHVALTHKVDFLVNYLPTGIDITYHWRFTDDRGDSVETAPKTLLWSDNRFDWQPISSHDITVYAYNQNPAFDKFVLDTAQTTADRLKASYGVDQVIPIRIWIYNSGKDFAATQQRNSQDAVAGTAYPDFHVILAILPEGGKTEVGRVIPHEISHQLLHQATKNPFNAPPLWLDEGLAVYNQANGNQDDQAMVADAAKKGHLFSIRALNSEFPLDTSDFYLAYAESDSIIRFILDRFGEDKLKAVIAAYRTGVSHDDALRAGLGVDIHQLDQLWKQSLNYRGDRPRAAASTNNPSPWTGFFGTGLAGGGLILLIGLLVVGLHRLAVRRRVHHSPSRAA